MHGKFSKFEQKIKPSDYRLVYYDNGGPSGPRSTGVRVIR